ncbi:MAG: hypothetical protein A3E87_10090 [Gammaproteobacteria bacterium RIFCSPHIGHO2_12_FULL_35_23]|nr:MAG: hypothetical protein A3E87_10090 [Gammaproteobacteria bacterium RIFCSPHIGHO2_12_FULL_35_23]
MHSIYQAAYFLITTLFNLYLSALFLRIILHWRRADYFNPLSQFIIKITSSVIKPIKKFVPEIKGIEISTILVLLIIEVIKLFLLLAIAGIVPPIIIFLAQLVADLASLILNLYFYLIIAVVVTSWIAASQYNSAIYLLSQITEPVLKLARKIIPPIAGFDLSPIIVLIVIKLLDILVVMPLYQIGLN